MEFVKGRIITDSNLAPLSATERRAAWFSLISTLAWLHSIDPDSIGLEGYGKKTGFYTRHCNTFSRIEAQQSKVKDISTGKELGRAHPKFDEIVDYIRRNLPSEKYSIIHGDYKFDNVILHPTEPRVIAILDWELSTIGHPLMDAVYVVGPYWNRATGSEKPRDDQGGEVYDPANQEESGMPSVEELLDEYTRIAGWDPRKDRWEVAKVFHLMRVSFHHSLCLPLVRVGLGESRTTVKKKKKKKNANCSTFHSTTEQKRDDRDGIRTHSLGLDIPEEVPVIGGPRATIAWICC